MDGEAHWLKKLVLEQVVQGSIPGISKKSYKMFMLFKLLNNIYACEWTVKAF